MVFKHNKLSFEPDDALTFQVAFHHVRQLDFGSRFLSSAHRRIPEKQTFLDGVRAGGNLEVESVTAVTSNFNCGIAFDHDVESVRSENNKRPVGSEENLQVAAKRTRQMDGKFPLFSSTCEESFTSSEERRTVQLGDLQTVPEDTIEVETVARD